MRLKDDYFVEVLKCLVLLIVFDRYNLQPEWSVFREASFGHGELKMVNLTHAFWSWHRNDDDEPVKSDQAWITSLVSSGCVTQKNHQLKKFR